MYITYKHVVYNVYYIIWKLSLKRIRIGRVKYLASARWKISRNSYFSIFFSITPNLACKAYQKNRTGLNVKILVNVIISKHFFRVTCVYYLILYKRNKVGVLPRRRMIDLIITASASKIKITRRIPTFFFDKNKTFSILLQIHFSLSWISSLKTLLPYFPISAHVNILTKILYRTTRYIGTVSGRRRIKQIL